MTDFYEQAKNQKKDGNGNENGGDGTKRRNVLSAKERVALVEHLRAKDREVLTSARERLLTKADLAGELTAALGFVVTEANLASALATIDEQWLDPDAKGLHRRLLSIERSLAALRRDFADHVADHQQPRLFGEEGEKSE